MFLVRLVLYLAACTWLLLALPGAGTALAGSFSHLVGQFRAGDAAARAFALGAALFLPLALVARTPLRFWYTLAHELSHGLTAILLGGHPEAIEASASGQGRTTFLRAPAVFWLVLLAPYVLSPAHAVPALVPWLDRGARAAGAAAAGAATAFALVANVVQIRAYQSDIRRSGLLRSLLFLSWGNLTLTALSIAVPLRGYGAAWTLLRTALTPLLP